MPPSNRADDRVRDWSRDRGAGRAAHRLAQPGERASPRHRHAEGEALGVWTHGHVTTLHPAGGPVDPAWPDVLAQLTRHYGGSPYEWGEIVYDRLEPTWMIAYSSGE
jgi:hypothetical protein